MKTAPFLHTMSTPLGDLTIGSNDEAVHFVTFETRPPATSNHSELPPVISLAIKELEAYFSGELREFTVPILPDGTPFQQSVWMQLLQIPYARLSNYSTIAKQLGDAKKVRAVGGANGRNPIAIIVPCHRVIGADASLTGYAGGLWRKHWLLAHEQKWAMGVQTLF